MSVQFFVGGIAWAVRDTELADHFSQFGEVTIDTTDPTNPKPMAKIVMERDPQTGRPSNRSKGFGFITMNIEETPEAINALIAKTAETEIMGRPISVRQATPSTREERPAYQAQSSE